MKNILSSIARMTASGNRLELPKEPLANYAQVKKTLLKAGGKYSKNGFTFLGPAEEIQQRLCGGEKIDDKKKFQFFATPGILAHKLAVMLAATETHKILEPSGGEGALIYAMRMNCDSYLDITTVELDPLKVLYLRKRNQTCRIVEADFLDWADQTTERFDRILANPPFTNNQDIDHVMKMFALLAEGGRLVTVMSTRWQSGSQRKQIAFREFLEASEARIEQLPSGTFKDSGTLFPATIITLNN